MKKVIKERQVTLGGRMLELPQSKKGEGHFLAILSKIEGQASAMLSHHSKILAVRLDLHLFEASNTNTAISSLIRWLRKRLSQSYHLNRLGYVWCREQNKSTKQHYHLVLIVDANKHRHPALFLDLTCRYWEQERDIGTVFIPKHCYYLVKRNDHGAFQKMFDRLSYLAKVSTKSPSLRSQFANDYEGSRIKHKEKS